MRIEFFKLDYTFEVIPGITIYKRNKVARLYLSWLIFALTIEIKWK